MTANIVSPSSFRDPSGYIFYQDGVLYRQINTLYQEHYTHLMESGLYDDLVGSGLLVSHEEVDISGPDPGSIFKIIKPQKIGFISYPYEWCFSQLKAAAMATLNIQKRALDFGMTLKDCSVYNIQFYNGAPVLIDTLSFEKYREGRPWVAYKQFCQHFLAPLVLMSYKDIRLSQLLRLYIDGVPLDLASSLLPVRTRFRFGLLSHIHFHAKSQKHYADKTIKPQTRKFSLLSFRGLVDNLESIISKRLTWQAFDTEWASYYDETNYSTESFKHKKSIVADLLSRLSPANIWDLGANTGHFSRISGELGIPTIAFDIDPAAVEKNYLECVKNRETNILPLIMDLTNPSPCLGWENRERMSFLERGPADTVLALALIHHLAISNNVPLARIADFFHKLCTTLIIEFIPKEDSQVQRLLATREDIFTAYTQAHFEGEFAKFFNIVNSEKIKTSTRTLYCMERK